MSENWTTQVSLKTPAGSLINLRADNPASVEHQLQWVTDNAAKIVEAEKAFGAVATVAGAFPGAQVVPQQPAPQAPQYGSQQGSWSGGGTQQQAPAPAAQGEGKSCVHGAMAYREGRSAKGPWRGYFCPTPKGTPGQCAPEFLRG